MQYANSVESRILTDETSPTERYLVDTFLLWAKLWSPFMDREQFQRSAQQQDLSEPVQHSYDAIFNLFHVGFPAPTVSALMHASLNQDGGRVREDIVRILSFMDLQWSEQRLPPDHIAVLCDILAALVYERQLPLANLLLERYILPWLTISNDQLGSIAGTELVSEFLSTFASDTLSCRHYLADVVVPA